MDANLLCFSNEGGRRMPPPGPGRKWALFVLKTAQLKISNDNCQHNTGNLPRHQNIDGASYIPRQAWQEKCKVSRKSHQHQENNKVNVFLFHSFSLLIFCDSQGGPSQHPLSINRLRGTQLGQNFSSKTNFRHFASPFGYRFRHFHQFLSGQMPHNDEKIGTIIPINRF